MHPLLARLVDPTRSSYGAWITLDAEGVVATLSATGYDFLGLDCQHGALSEAAAARLLRRAAGAPTPLLVRVSANRPELLGRVLDAGADGVVVPLVDDPDQARAAVAGCRFPPDGARSYGPTRADLPRSPGALAARAACFVMIETRTAVSRADEIAAVPGLAGIIVGPADLAISYGAEPRAAFTTDAIAEPLAQVRRACEAHGIKLGVFAGAGAGARRWTEQGVRLVITGSDTGMLAAAARADLQAARNGTDSTDGTDGTDDADGVTAPPQGPY